MSKAPVYGGIAVVLMILLAILASTPISRDFSPENPYWNGLSLLRRVLEDYGYKTVIARRPLDNYPKGSGIALIVIAPETSLSREELDYLRKHLALGGVLLLLDDFAYGNDILKGLGTSVRIIGKPVLDPIVNLGHETLPVATIIDPAYLKLKDVSLVLNIPSALEVKKSTEWFVKVIAITSEYSFVDYNGNWRIDRNETRKELPVAVTLTRRGYKGSIVVISDASFVLNSMLEKGANKELLLRVLKQYRVKTVIIDDFHHRRSLIEEVKRTLNEVSEWILYALSDPLGRYLFILLLVLGLLMLASRAFRVYENV